MVYWEADELYFLTTSTFLHYPYFELPEQKRIVLNQFKKVIKELEASCYAYSIAVNHYHIILQPKSDKDFTEAKRMINGGTAFEYKKLYPQEIKDRYLWGDVKTLKIFSRDSLLRIIGYVTGNLLKHREVKNFQELKESSFSSYHRLVEKHGDELAEDLVLSVIEVPENKGHPEWGKLWQCPVNNKFKKTG